MARTFLYGGIGLVKVCAHLCRVVCCCFLLVACGEGESLGAGACNVYAVCGNLGSSTMLQYEEQLLALVVHGYNMYLGNVSQLAAAYAARLLQCIFPSTT